MELRPIIEKPSPGSKNLSKGETSEKIVKQYFLHQGFDFLFQRQKLKYAEVDLAFKKKNAIYFIEVKSLHNPWMSFERLGQKQRKRLLQNLVYYQNLNRQYQLKCLLCFVDQDCKISIIDLAQ